MGVPQLPTDVDLVIIDYTATAAHRNLKQLDTVNNWQRGGSRRMMSLAWASLTADSLTCNQL